ncbi:S-layer homology domain-containing protein [Paenisporosarcina cavernae]|uniref:S-layer homology domain-containing protein n=1 Tax=Paenisporosarcina cavernae TaxID=2320858 RepID=A0A385YTW8_9BACL|nr:S-layer homology domain-containing protein [Paenisporosarcina cavernae]AYC28923.1 S-layer homology domain-containing protein [Paenisporosarcina cavernae]
MKKWLASIAIAAMVTTGVGNAEAASSSVRDSIFSDLSIHNKLYEPVYSMYLRGIVGHDNGIPLNLGNKMYPLDEITRAQAANYLYKLLGMSFDEKKMAFNDVQTGHPNYEAISTMAAKDVIDGYPDGTFRPNEKLTRAQMAKIIAKAFELNESSEPVPFTDVNDRFYPYVSSIYAENITRGKTVTQYGSNDFITKQEMAAFLERAHKTRLGSEYNDQEIQMVTDELIRKIRVLMNQALNVYYPNQKENDIAADLKELATNTAYSELVTIYKNSCNHCDGVVLRNMDFALKYELVVETDNRIVLETAVPEDLYLNGKNYTVEIIKTDGEWKLKTLKSSSFEEKPLQLTEDEVKAYIAHQLYDYYKWKVRSISFMRMSDDGNVELYEVIEDGNTHLVGFNPLTARVTEEAR